MPQIPHYAPYALVPCRSASFSMIKTHQHKDSPSQFATIMTSEMHQLANDPNFVVEFAIGDPIPDLIPQPKNSGIQFSQVHFDKTKRYIMKKAHMSKDDVRILDMDTGRVVLVSHHPGKDPYESFDPLGLGNGEQQHQVQGGEWESACDVTSHDASMQSFKIRPKTISRHGRQYIQRMEGDETIMNVGKMSKFSTMSMRPHFEVGRGKDGESVYTIAADMMERTFTIRNEKDEVVCQVAKTAKALIQTAVFGSGSESTIDIAPGVDCSTVLAIVFGLGQVGAHFVKDSFQNYVVDPIKDSITGNVIETAGLEGAAEAYTEASNEAISQSHKLEKFHKFFKDTFG